MDNALQTTLLTGIDVQDTLGAVSIGALISLFLFGAITLQAYMYLIHFRNDIRKLKALVGFVWLCELLHCISVVHMLYYYTILRYGDLSAIGNRPPPTLPLSMIIGGIETCIIKIFFSERVRTVSGGKLYIPVPCCLLSVLLLGMITLTSVKVCQITTVTAFQDQFNWLVTVDLCLGAGIEIILASSLCYYLAVWKKELDARSTIESVGDIMTRAIESGVVTSVCALSTAVCFLKMPRNFIWLAFFVCLPRCVSNALLLSLNSRLKSQHNHLNGLVELHALNQNAKNRGYRLRRRSIRHAVISSEVTTDVSMSSRNSISAV